MKPERGGMKPEMRQIEAGDAAEISRNAAERSRRRGR